MEDLQELPLFLEVHPRPVKFTRCTLPKIIYTCGGETKARNILVAPHAVVVVVVVVVVVAVAVAVAVVVVVVVVVLVVLVVGECHVVALVPPWWLGSRARRNDTPGGSCLARSRAREPRRDVAVVQLNDPRAPF